MSAMSEIATELELHWIPMYCGYRHVSGDYLMLWWNSNRDTMALYMRIDDEWAHIMDSEIHTAVARVMASTAAEIAADLVANNPALLADALENTRQLVQRGN